LYQITAASRSPDYGAIAHRYPFSLPSNEFVEPSLNKTPGYATDSIEMFSAYTQKVNLKVL